MKRFLYSLLLPLSILCSCIYEDEADCCRPTKVRVEMTVRPDPMMTVTRADEATIRDLNFYLCGDNGEIVLHHYQTSATLRFECLPGDYRMRIAANMGRDLGENPASDDFTVSHADEYDVLPMAYEGDITIIPSENLLSHYRCSGRCRHRTAFRAASFRTAFGIRVRYGGCTVG